MRDWVWLSDVYDQLTGGRLGRGVPWWEGNKCKHDLLCGRTCDGESPSDEGQRRGEEGMKERETQSLGGTHDQMEVCLDENGFLRSGQFECL